MDGPAPVFLGAATCAELNCVAKFSEAKLGRRTPIRCDLEGSGSSGAFRWLSEWSGCCLKRVGRCEVYSVREFRLLVSR